MDQYQIGERDDRAWGWFEVTDLGHEGSEEFCEKTIGIHAFQALSLQRHHGRREFWAVMDGTLTVVLNGELITLEKGESISIPFKAPHCMMNLSDRTVVVYEKQMGVCREDDNDRLADMYGRETLPIDSDDTLALKSRDVYEQALEQIKANKQLRKAS